MRVLPGWVIIEGGKPGSYISQIVLILVKKWHLSNLSWYLSINEMLAGPCIPRQNRPSL